MRKHLKTISEKIVEPINEVTEHNWYITGYTFKSEFVGTVDLNYDELSSVLRLLGYKPNLLASYKEKKVYADGEWTPTGRWEKTTWRLPTNAEEPYARIDRNQLGDWQLHVTLYDLDDDENTTCVFGHWEYNWLTHPIKHYHPPSDFPKNKLGSTMVKEQLRYAFQDDYDEFVEEDPETIEELKRIVENKELGYDT